MATPFNRKPITKMGSFMVCMKEVFDVPSGKTLMDFAHEMRQLDARDRAYFIVELDKLGYRVVN